MPEKSIQTLLKENFLPASYEKWKMMASLELQGKDPVESLRRETTDELIFSPYYDRESLDGLGYLEAFQLQAGDGDPTAPGRTWSNVPEILVVDTNKSNQLSLHYLNQGADGIFFNLTEYKSNDFELLLKKIEWPYCPLFFTCDEHQLIEISDYIAEKKYSEHALTGGFFLTKSPANPKAFFLFRSQRKLSLGLTIKPTTPVEEIADALSGGVHLIESHILQKQKPGDFFQQITFSLEAGADFILTIAKFKALRFLWFQVAHAYAIKNYTPSQLHVHGRSSAWVNETYQPHANMLKSTTAAMACIMGGCNSVTLMPEDTSSTFMNRVALNVQTILREESHFDKVADPLAGAYVIDYMVNNLAEKAWKKFAGAMI